MLAAIGLPAALLAEDPSRLMPANNILVIVGVAVMVGHFGASGILLGHFPDAQYTPVEHRIADGDRVVLYTDGIIEATNRQGEFFDPERLREFVARHPGGPSGTFCGALLDHLSSWCDRGPDSGGFEDDITLVVASLTTADA